MRSIKEAFKNIGRNKSISFAAIFMSTLTLFILGSVLVTSIIVTDVSNTRVEELNIVVYLDKNLSNDVIEEVGAQIKAQEFVKSADFSSKEDELNKVASSYETDSDMIQDYFGSQNPLNDVYIVNIVDTQDNIQIVSEELSQIPNVENVDYGSSSVDAFIETIKNIQLILFVSAIIAFIISVFLISLTIKLAIEHRQKEIKIMRLVGATRGYIRRPFLMEGTLIGLFGSIIPYFLINYTYSRIYSSSAISSEIKEIIMPPDEMLKFLLIALIIFGMLIGLIGAYLAIQKTLKEDNQNEAKKY